MVTKLFTKGDDQLNGIFCSLKNTITVNKASNQRWNNNLNPNVYFCKTDPHDIYPIDPYQCQYIEFQLNGYYVKPNEYVLKGRSVHGYNLPKDWNFLGFNGDKWVILNETRDDILYQNAFRSYNLYSKQFFSAFRLQTQGITTSGDWHLCIESIEVYGVLSTNPHKVRFSACSKSRSHLMELFTTMLLLS